eukprot:CAMPEP_0178902636 /NCGR_PEP_ID=MMETSP0786-20121207/4715_1 /TAXON_ID=186022 /ORGANISM="Thalassionema frauenfeldii, Strain CCMP 1798" /LENGTH=191 /DNA_ID=CAMNT_0020573925 /DNA_START=596 /DNA_END=1167 /DNA_ORIENTATION=+
MDYGTNINALLGMNDLRQLGLQSPLDASVPVMQPLQQGNSLPFHQHSLENTFLGKVAATLTAPSLDYQGQDSELLQLLAKHRSLQFNESGIRGTLLQGSGSSLMNEPSFSSPKVLQTAAPMFPPSLTARAQGGQSMQGTANFMISNARNRGSASITNAKPAHPVDLYMKCDDDTLSDYQILLRKQIEFFEA